MSVVAHHAASSSSRRSTGRRPIGRRVRRFGLATFFLSIAVNAALGIYAVLAPDFGETQEKILGTSLCVTGAAVLALACEPTWERRLPRRFAGKCKNCCARDAERRAEYLLLRLSEIRCEHRVDSESRIYRDRQEEGCESESAHSTADRPTPGGTTRTTRRSVVSHDRHHIASLLVKARIAPPRHQDTP